MEIASNPPATAEKHHAAFFRQSGWLMMATIIGGMMSWAVHLLAKRIPDAQYSIFGTLLMITACLPTLPLQMVLAQQTANALATDRRRQLAGVIRLISLWLAAVWLVAMLIVFVYQGRIVARLELTNPAALWVTMLAALVSLLSPMFGGALQGKQDFFWMGWTAIIMGMTRLVLAAVFVLGFQTGATGMMIGALVGLSLSAAVAIWQTRDLWWMKPEPFDKQGLFRQVVPLLLGFGACQFMFTTDTIFAKSYFTGDEMAPYVAAGTLSRALLWLVLPIAAVMFPKLVHSSVKAEKTNLLAIVLLGTGVLSICGALGMWLTGPIMIPLVWKAAWAKAAVGLLPWYALAMVPLALGNVLVNDLLARSRFRIVPVMVALAIAYGFALTRFHTTLVMVLQTLGVFNLLLLAAGAWFTWRDRPATAATKLS